MNPEHSDSDSGSIFTVKTNTTAPTEWTSEEGIDPHDESDVMSVLESLYGGDSTYSLSSSVLNYHFENGRRYHAYHEGKYIMPNDDQEQNKLMLMHLCYALVFDGRLHLSPISTNPQNVLDIGTGRGDWAIDFAEAYPSARVIGTDLSPIQPLWVPPNCTFEIDDAEDEWLYTQQFDLIHTRTICGAIRDWPRFHRQAFDHVKPGGWFEMQENDAWFQRDDGSCPEWTQMFLEKLDEASILSGRRLNVARDQKQYMIDAGFINVHDVIFRLPLSPWHSDPRMKEIGRLRGLAMNEGVEGYSLALYTRFLGWSPNEVRILLAKVRSEFNDVRNQMYIAVHVVYGQKPEEVA
ncbi:conserved hypothetical protein [Talaromyces stipitatus ATCC 10500]|uniref:S-adenosyl-L-methionine-dependent methyltransferase n=1 Tax=Talaromyces stipitatus (strain ATCC 10500 / CBS 375.48 / QM 6759 / NRRL 1006) TaxID=441959 RepID=B8M1J8_TALSN|nr:uncharacterized protein TSTA_093310 [Talaromyces stipitatus ATCC 10500]EED22085.1 conserved hypothetical protein [Talaromyces stipitatus ATCC 10500]